MVNRKTQFSGAQELSESPDGRPGLPSLKNPTVPAEPLTDVNGHHRVVTAGADVDVRPSVTAHVHRLARATPLL